MELDQVRLQRLDDAVEIGVGRVHRDRHDPGFVARRIRQSGRDLDGYVAWTLRKENKAYIGSAALKGARDCFGRGKSACLGLSHGPS